MRGMGWAAGGEGEKVGPCGLNSFKGFNLVIFVGRSQQGGLLGDGQAQPSGHDKAHSGRRQMANLVVFQ